MKNLISIMRTITLMFLIFMSTSLVFGENICDDNIFVTYDENTKEFTLHFDEKSETKIFYIKAYDLESVFDIKLDNEYDGWYSFTRKIDVRANYSKKKNDTKFLPYYLKKDENGSSCYMEIKNITIESIVPDSVIGKQNNIASSNKKLMCLYIAIVVLVVIIIILIITIVINKKRKDRTLNDNNSKDDVIAAVEEIAVDKKKGLQHVYLNKNDYFAVNMNEMFDDTAIKTVYFSKAIIGKLNCFFKGFLENSERTNETGCYLIGCWDYNGNNSQYDISIEQMVLPGKDAVFNEYTLNFGREIGITLSTMIDDLVEKTKQDYVRTSWMHSHPGLGLFLSSHDLIVQKQLAYSDAPNRLLAIVIDTNTPDWSMAMFTPKTNGIMNNKQELKKTISFDTLYLWSKQKSTNQSANSDFFTLRVGLPGINTINFSGKSINQMDDIVYSGKNGIAGYFYGSKRGNDIYIDKCLQYNNVDAVGCLMNDARISCDSISASLTAMVDGCDFVMVCCNSDKMSLFVKKDNFYQKCPQCDTAFMEYKEWTRRKRI